MSSLGKTGKVIRQAYQLNFGNLYLNTKDAKLAEEKYCYRVSPFATYPEKDEPPPFNVDKIVECLEKSPQIDKVALCKNGQDVEWEGLGFDPRIRWHFNPPLRIELNFPVKNQETTQFMKRVVGDAYETSNRFEVFYDGSNYIVCTTIKDVKKVCGGATDVQNLLANLLEKEFNVETVPPSPMREEYYLAFMLDKSTEEDFKTISESLTPYQILLPFAEKGLKRRRELISRILCFVRDFLDVFYAESMLSTHLEEESFLFNILQRDIQKKTRELLDLPSYRFLHRRKTKSVLENLILKHYECVVEFSLCSNLIREAKANLTSLSEGSSLSFFPFRKNLSLLVEDNLRYDKFDIELFNASLDYTKKLLERTFSWRLALYGVFFGAMAALAIEYGPDIFSWLTELVSSLSN